MLRSGLKLGGLTSLATLATSLCVSAQSSRASAGYFPGSSITGTIVDAEGIPQMGALVELLLPDASLVATALTDARGRYRVSDLKPGSYRLRASAALFLPTVRQKLELATGSRAVVNLTLSTLLATSQWLPATRRTSNSDDDWMWALRSSTMRPVLRVVDDNSTDPLTVSTSATEVRGIRTEGRVSVQSNSGGFARGGNHNLLALDRQNGRDSTVMLRADFSGARTPYPVAPSTELGLGWERHLPLNAVSRSVLSYSSHPELLDRQGNNGAQTAVLRNAQRMELGDSVRVDAGSVLREFNLAGNAVAMEPFLKFAFRAGNNVVIAYTFTEARGTESIDDLNRTTAAMPVATLRDGHLRMEHGRHDAVSIAGRTWHDGTVQFTVYRDRLANPAIYGAGILALSDRSGNATLVDPTTQSFAVTSRDYSPAGFRFVVNQPVSSAIALGGEFSDGTSLKNQARHTALLSDLLNSIAAHKTVSAAFYVDGKFVRTGTKFHTGYRWQPEESLTAVDAFHNERDTAYLNCRVRQSLSRLPLIPGGMEAVLDVQNLLAEGYQPFLSSDGRTLYLTQTPRVLQAGLSFSF